MPVVFIPNTAAPTHFGRFRSSGALGIFDDRGAPFLPDQLAGARIIVEAAFGADVHADSSTWTWIDITADVMYSPGITISQGRADETSQASPAGCTFSVDNETAAYSAFNPAGIHYPYVRRNTPVRVSVDPGSGIAQILFQGEAAGWTPTWDTSANLAIVQVVAAGALRRLTQGKVAVPSSLYTKILSTNNLLYYWPMEDATTGSKFIAAFGGKDLLIAAGSSAVFAAESDLAGSAPLPKIDSTLHHGVALATVSASTTANGWVVGFAFKATSSSAGSMQRTIAVLPINDATYIQWTIEITDATGKGVQLFPTFPDGSTDFPVVQAGGGFIDGNWHYAVVRVTTSGGNVTYRSYVDGTLQDSLTRAATGTGAIRKIMTGADDDPNIVASNVGSFSMGHLAIWALTPTVSAVYDAMVGHIGEAADTRITRLCGEQGVSMTVVGTSTTAMGPQTVVPLVDLLRECEAADGGVLFDGFSAGLSYTCRTSRYNLAAALTLDVSSGDVAPPFAPVDDDQRNRNDVTADRGGTPYRYTDTNGPLGVAAIGTYDTSVTVNTATDDPLLNMAAWQVHLGTVRGLRYPTLSLDFAASPAQVAPWLAAPDVSFRADVVNASQKATQHPPDDVPLIVEGYTQTINPRTWKVNANCSSFAPWRVAVFDAIRYDSAASTLYLPAPAGSGTLSVLVGDGTRWATGVVSFDINVGGVHFPVTNIAGTATPQTFTIGAPTNGVVKDLPAGTSVRIWTTPVYAL